MYFSFELSKFKRTNLNRHSYKNHKIEKVNNDKKHKFQIIF